MSLLQFQILNPNQVTTNYKHPKSVVSDLNDHITT